ncbi:MAG: sodium:proton antiporter [Clostridiales Family XIII bacterium]|jgi:Na+/H+ antiporter NhaC|nr:sodium:proton antiporter [Clostridiales Family XIII bacterium]
MELTANFGLLTLVPPIVIIVFALLTRKTFEALVLGAILAFVMSDGIGVIGALLDAMMRVVGDNAWMWMTLGLFGSFVALLTCSRGTYGFSQLVAKYANGPKKSLVLAWILGIIVFMDDYLNILTVSAAMRDVSDKHKNPREMIAYVIDSTGAPVCVLVPLSTWAVFFGGVFGDQAELAELGGGMTLYYQSIPFIFYAWAAIIIVPLVALRVIPPLFGMRKAYERVERTGMVYSERSKPLNADGVEAEAKNGNIWNFLLPILLLIVVSVYTEDLLVGLVYALILQLVLYLLTKTISFDVFALQLAKGFANMIPMLFICVGALTVKIAMDAISLPAYIINAVLPYMTPALFPAITFVVVAGLSFITGSNWGIPAVTVPIIAPLAVLSGASVPMTLGAIVSGGTFGSHACFYSDATVLTSQASGIDNLEHAFSQIPYGLIGAVIAVILYVIFGVALA